MCADLPDDDEALAQLLNQSNDRQQLPVPLPHGGLPHWLDAQAVAQAEARLYARDALGLSSARRAAMELPRLYNSGGLFWAPPSPLLPPLPLLQPPPPPPLLPEVPPQIGPESPTWQASPPPPAPQSAIAGGSQLSLFGISRRSVFIAAVIAGVASMASAGACYAHGAQRRAASDLESNA